ncbi:MAG: poly-beta-hydroxybutyrate polymerase N-terminal domain-containing protein [Burkholderiaceae bacterium]
MNDQHPHGPDATDPAVGADRPASKDSPDAPTLDVLTLNALSHWTRGLSPASLVPAMTAWTSALATSPGTQLQLWQRAWS